MVSVSTATIGSISNLASQIIKALADDRDCLMDLSETVLADLSFIQLIEAARIQAKSAGLSLRLVQPANVLVTALLRRAGFLTAPTPADIDFWFHGALPQ